jgi:hypothetical protein
MLRAASRTQCETPPNHADENLSVTGSTDAAR